MKRVLVTGSAGYIGRHVVATLARAGIDVVPYDLVDGLDVLDLASLRHAFDGCDGAVHLAMEWGKERATLLDANMNGARNVLDAASAVGVARVVMTSSIRAMGSWFDGTSPRYLPIDDDHPDEPIDDYSVTKLAIERMAARRDDVSTVCIRPPAPYGDDGVRAALERRRADPGDEWTPHWQYGAWVHVDDLAAAFLAALTCAPPAGGNAVVVTVADDINTDRYTSRELARRFNPDVEWRGGPEYDTDPQRALVVARRGRGVIGWTPTRRWGVD